MKCLLLIAHGSRKTAANEELNRLVEQVERMAGDRFDLVLPAYLEFAEPDIQQAIDQCLQMGGQSIVVVPYFLSGGNHVGRDIPEQLDVARARYPKIEIEQADYIGSSQAMAGLVIESAKVI